MVSPREHFMCTWEEWVFWCCWMECSVSVSQHGLQCVQIFHFHVDSILCLPVLSNIESGILMSPTIIVELWLSPFISLIFCFMYFRVCCELLYVYNLYVFPSDPFSITKWPCLSPGTIFSLEVHFVWY